MKILTKEQILLLHSQLVKEFGGSLDIRDDSLLESAIIHHSKHTVERNCIRLYWIKPLAYVLDL